MTDTTLNIDVPPAATVAMLIALLRAFPQDMLITKDGTLITRISIVPADFGQMVSIT